MKLTSEKITIFLLIIIFLTFLGYEKIKKTSFYVLEIISPTQIVIDLNQNGIKDDGETIYLNMSKSFSTKPSEKQSLLAKKLNITQEESTGLGYLAETFAKTTLLDKSVKYNKNPYPRIYVENKDYETLLMNSGLAVKENEKITPQLSKNIEKVHKLNLRIFNNKSLKYHKLTCKYGILSHNSQILPMGQIPKDAKPCKFCLQKHKNYSKKTKQLKNTNWQNETIPNIPQAPTILKKCGLEIFLTDLTRTLKPDNNCSTALCRTLLREINSSQKSIDFAIYGYTKVPAIQKALEAAQCRGVKIRFVYDTDGKNENIYPDTAYLTKILQNNANDFGQKDQNSIMHNKFFIFDSQKVLTGSANISNTDMSGFNSNAIILINSPRLANIYETEFEQMYSGRFHKTKSPIQKNTICLTDTELSVYFSPKDKAITTELIPLIDSAQKYIYMPIFLITHKGLTQSLINAKNRGVSVKIIIDATNSHTSASKHKMLRENGIQVKTENFAGKLHSKSMIIDDTYTVIGSMNFSKSGETVNDENILILKNREIALFYKTFFQYLWNRIPNYWLTHNARSESPDSVGSCSDGIDNDFDGKIDKADDSCKMTKK